MGGIRKSSHFRGEPLLDILRTYPSMNILFIILFFIVDLQLISPVVIIASLLNPGKEIEKDHIKILEMGNRLLAPEIVFQRPSHV